MSRKFYSLNEANQQLPAVNKELLALQDLKRQFAEKYLELRRSKQNQTKVKQQGEDPYFALETELEFLQIEANSHIANFESNGIELKDIDMGLVDFPAMIGGVEVLLCWRQGEEKIAYYHSRTEGFAGRKAITE